MSVIAGVTVDFIANPRVITIPAPLLEVSIQDLHDTVRNLEDEPSSMQYPHLIDSAGKEDLGSGKAVGITATLQNARLAFEARLGPAFEQCIVTGGNLVAKDENGDTINPVEPTSFTQVVIEKSSSPTSLDIGALTTGKFLALK